MRVLRIEIFRTCYERDVQCADGRFLSHIPAATNNVQGSSNARNARNVFFFAVEDYSHEIWV